MHWVVGGHLSVHDGPPSRRPGQFLPGPADSFIGLINLVIAEATHKAIESLASSETTPQKPAAWPRSTWGASLDEHLPMSSPGSPTVTKYRRGGMSPFSVDIFEPCEVFAAAAGAWAL